MRSLWQLLLHLILAPGAVVVLVILATGAATFVLPSLFDVLLVSGVFALLVAWPFGMAAARHGRRWALLDHISSAVRLNAPLPPALRAAARSESRRVRWQLRRVAERIENGDLLQRALTAGAPDLSEREVRAIGAAERAGRLPQALERLLAPAMQPDRHESKRRSLLLLVYSMFMALLILWMTSSFLIWIIPKYRQIFADFNIELPALTERLVALAHARPGSGFIILSLSFLFFFVGTSLLAVWLIVTAMWPATVSKQPLRTIVRPFTDTAAWITPVLRGLSRDRGLADAFAALAEATEAGGSLEAAVTEALQLRVNLHLRRRLRRWRDALSNGDDAGNAARRARLPRLASGMLGSAEAAGNLPAALRFLSSYYQQRHGRNAELLRGALVPATVLLLATAVAFLVLAMILPLNAVLESQLRAMP